MRVKLSIMKFEKIFSVNFTHTEKRFIRLQLVSPVPTICC